ncbi:MAG: chromosome segregation protein SMC [Actinomycetota bacterium]|nr:chromosome segregation protein SMC [Actinomycetota bacterium]
MFLKALSIRGFKSFADKAVLDFEPGLTAVVGPNGSGKSNLVDALAWVLGTRSPKLLRGSELADVIFAGSPTRPPLGRAAVEMTIDNSDGRLGSNGVGLAGSGQQFTEVRITREIFTTGENRYAINGAECRLLDVHELLSDAGMGRELHTIVGQGQLDSLLHAKPEERRALVEEAAGILKHRQRRERAQRKLDQVAGHVDRLRTLLRELRRQLKPLERQAEAANRSAQLQAELRIVRLRLAACDFARLRASWQEVCSHESETKAQLETIDGAVAKAEGDLAAAEEQLRCDAPLAEQARVWAEDLGRLHERLGGTVGLVSIRRRHLLEEIDQPLAGRPPAELRTQADRLDAERVARETARGQAEEDVAAADAASRAAELARHDHERRRAAASRERAEARERHTRWEGQVQAHRNTLAACEAESARLGVQIKELSGRMSELEDESRRVLHETAALEKAERDLSETVERTRREVAAAEAALEAAVEREREVEQGLTSHVARAEALRAATTDQDDGAASLLSSGIDGLYGRLAEHVRVIAGGEAAVAAALGPFGGAIVVRSRDDAERAVAELRSLTAGRGAILPLDHRQAHGVSAPAPPARSVAELLEARDGDAGVAEVVRRVLADTYLAASWSEAVALQAEHPGCTFVTWDGDLVGPLGFVGGQAPERSALVTVAAAEEAERLVEELGAKLAETRVAVLAAREALSVRRAGLEKAGARHKASEACLTRAREQLARRKRELKTLEAHRGLVTAQRDELAATAAHRRTALGELEAAEPPRPTDEPPGQAPDRVVEPLDQEVQRTRMVALEARLELERLNEQIRHLADAASALRLEATQVEEALLSAQRRRERRRAQLRRCEDLAVLAADALAATERALQEVQLDRDSLEGVRRRREATRDGIRAQLDTLVGERERLRDVRHAAALQQASVRHELDELGRRVRELFGLSPDELGDEHPDADGFDRTSLEASAARLESRLVELGRVNPLALEEYQALEERHAFLSRQLDDLLASKRDLEKVIRAVDDKVSAVFAEAFADVAHEFEVLFGILFPGGRGRMVLTDPRDPLSTGIELEASPPRKRVRHLSLLSGGERSLTALAFLLAIFRARPAPFYILDEVDAALDDVNLERLLRLLNSFKHSAQLIVITHQRRTMEAADIVYGVTMGADAVSKVVGERLAAAPA